MQIYAVRLSVLSMLVMMSVLKNRIMAPSYEYPSLRVIKGSQEVTGQIFNHQSICVKYLPSYLGIQSSPLTTSFSSGVGNIATKHGSTRLVLSLPLVLASI